MKILLPLLAAVGLAARAPQAVTTQDATAELRPFMERVYAAWSTFDPANAAPFYAKEANLVFFDVAPMKYQGWQAYEDGFKQVARDWQSGKVSLGPDFTASRRGDTAWVTYTAHLDLTLKNGQKMTPDVRGTDVLERRGSDWLIVHEHVSVPMPEPPAAPPAKK